jgi:hypothetical protein
MNCPSVPTGAPGEPYLDLSGFGVPQYLRVQVAPLIVQISNKYHVVYNATTAEDYIITLYACVHQDRLRSEILGTFRVAICSLRLTLESTNARATIDK